MDSLKIGANINHAERKLSGLTIPPELSSVLELCRAEIRQAREALRRHDIEAAAEWEKKARLSITFIAFRLEKVA